MIIFYGQNFDSLNADVLDNGAQGLCFIESSKSKTIL